MGVVVVVVGVVVVGVVVVGVVGLVADGTVAGGAGIAGATAGTRHQRVAPQNLTMEPSIGGTEECNTLVMVQLEIERSSERRSCSWRKTVVAFSYLVLERSTEDEQRCFVHGVPLV